MIINLHAWDDYETFTVKLTGHTTAGIGRTWLRARSPEALAPPWPPSRWARRVAAIEAAGLGEGWTEDEPGYGRVFQFTDPDGHPYGLYWDTRPMRAVGVDSAVAEEPGLTFPGRGANIRRLDHVNFLAADVPANESFLADLLTARASEQIVLDDGTKSGLWYTVTDKFYDLVYTQDWTGSRGRLHHVAVATDTREDILRAADVFLEAGIYIETGPHKHAIQQTFFLYVWEPGGNRIGTVQCRCSAAARPGS